MQTSILIVEDEALIALDLKERLEEAGYTVPMITDNALDALIGVERHQPGLILMDIRLRGSEDGIEAADRIRYQFHVPVMFVTAFADRETLERAKITEPFGYIVKPFHSVDFRAQVEMALWKHKMERQLAISEAWLSSTIRNVADALIATDPEGNIVFMNQPAGDLTGWECGEATGQAFLDVFRTFEETTDLPVINPLVTILDGRELDSGPRIFKLIARAASGWVLVEAEISANSSEGVLLGVIVIFRDITRRRQDEIQNVQQNKRRLVSRMSVGLGGQLAESHARVDDMLQAAIATAEGPMLDLLAEIRQHASHQQSIIEQLLRLGRSETGRTSMICLNDVVRGLNATAKNTIGRSLKLDLEPDLPMIRVEHHALHEILIRLLVEAREATPFSGALDLATRQISFAEGEAGVRIVVSDSGSRIRAGLADRAFDPYCEIRSGVRNPGLSLAIVHQLVSLNGGRIEIESAAQGVTYLVSFPAAEHSRNTRLELPAAVLRALRDDLLEAQPVTAA